MIICKNCGVELEAGMQNCPLCREPVNQGPKIQQPGSYFRQALSPEHKMTAPQKKLTWEIVSITLLSAVVATLVINFIINKKITWSEYPAAVSLVIFSYVSLFAFWDRKSILQMTVGFFVSSGCLVGLDAITGNGTDWSVRVGIPLLLATNLIVIVFLIVIRSVKYKGINLVACGFLSAAVLCMCIEGILSFYETGSLQFSWSVVVTGCTIPVVLVLLFVHFRMKKGRSLKKTFHI